MQNKDEAIKHLKGHQKYPATRDELLKECDNLSDFSDKDKEWFTNHLPEGKEKYESADDVMQTLGWTEV